MEVFEGYFQPKSEWQTAVGTTGEKLLIAKQLNETKLKNDLTELLEAGIKSIAVVLMHSYT